MKIDKDVLKEFLQLIDTATNEETLSKHATIKEACAARDALVRLSARVKRKFIIDTE